MSFTEANRTINEKKKAAILILQRGKKIMQKNISINIALSKKDQKLRKVYYCKNNSRSWIITSNFYYAGYKI